MTSLYEHAGGEQAIHRLEFGEGQPHHVEHLTMFTDESFGGPPRFSAELGFAHLVAVRDR
jgi:hemoglobin